MPRTLVSMQKASIVWPNSTVLEGQPGVSYKNLLRISSELETRYSSTAPGGGQHAGKGAYVAVPTQIWLRFQSVVSEFDKISASFDASPAAVLEKYQWTLETGEADLSKLAQNLDRAPEIISEFELAARELISSAVELDEPVSVGEYEYSVIARSDLIELQSKMTKLDDEIRPGVMSTQFSSGNEMQASQVAHYVGRALTYLAGASVVLGFAVTFAAAPVIPFTVGVVLAFVFGTYSSRAEQISAFWKKQASEHWKQNERKLFKDLKEIGQEISSLFGVKISNEETVSVKERMSIKGHFEKECEEILDALGQELIDRIPASVLEQLPTDIPDSLMTTLCKLDATVRRGSTSSKAYVPQMSKLARELRPHLKPPSRQQRLTVSDIVRTYNETHGIEVVVADVAVAAQSPAPN